MTDLRDDLKEDENQISLEESETIVEVEEILDEEELPEETEPVEKEKATPEKPGGQKVISLAELKKKSS